MIIDIGPGVGGAQMVSSTFLCLFEYSKPTRWLVEVRALLLFLLEYLFLVFLL